MRNQSQNQSQAGKLLLLIVLAALVSRHLLAVLPEVASSFVWYACDVLRAIGMSAALGLCVTLIPWRMLRFKCLLAALCGYFLSDAIVCATWYAWGAPSPMLAMVFQGVGLSMAATYYWWRSYDQPQDLIAAEYLFCLRTRPRSAQDFLISLTGLYGSDGGYALYADGKLYRYHHGILVAQQIDRLPPDRYHVQRGARLTPAIIADLDSLVGERWSWRRNCLTVLGPLWRRYRE